MPGDVLLLQQWWYVPNPYSYSTVEPGKLFLVVAVNVLGRFGNVLELAVRFVGLDNDVDVWYEDNDHGLGAKFAMVASGVSGIR